jgi:hypothetical protein
VPFLFAIFHFALTQPKGRGEEKDNNIHPFKDFGFVFVAFFP